ncbi:hypothetical protein HYC85_000077 [Camellia sinensis]|uniref:Uncharacterized protein n=1 Tax=Camellia sinensis TaxID=4442 RepID=A0A7J7FPP1_CAMSI|nr:hypothetical protein HYC85_000077 [Camellia sinensis]
MGFLGKLPLIKLPLKTKSLNVKQENLSTHSFYLLPAHLLVPTAINPPNSSTIDTTLSPTYCCHLLRYHSSSITPTTSLLTPSNPVSVTSSLVNSYLTILTP